MRLTLVIVVILALGCEQRPDKRTESERGRWILDAQTELPVIRAFEDAGIEYRLSEEQGETTISWHPDDQEAVDQVSEVLFGRMPPEGRHISFVDDSFYERLQLDLDELGIESHVYVHEGPYGGLKYAYWEDSKTPEVVRVIESYGLNWYSEAEREQIRFGDADRITPEAAPRHRE